MVIITLRWGQFRNAILGLAYVRWVRWLYYATREGGAPDGFDQISGGCSFWITRCGNCGYGGCRPVWEIGALSDRENSASCCEDQCCLVASASLSGARR